MIRSWWPWWALTVGCTPPTTTSWTGPVVDVLREGFEGATVQEGRLFWLDRAGCAPIVEATGTCYGAHPGSPYGLFDFSGAATDASVDDVPHQPLAPHEAWVFAGHLPPAGRYWSFNVYQYLKAMDDGTQRVTFGSVAPVANLLNTPAGGVPLPDSGQHDPAEVPFGASIVLIITANPGTAAWVTERLTPRLEAAGIGPEAIVVQPIAYRTPEGVADLIEEGTAPERVYSLTMGRESVHDTFSVALRVVGLDPSDPYLDPRTVAAAPFQITLDAPLSPADPYPWPVLPPPADTGERQPDRLAEARDQVATWLATQAEAAGHQTVRVAMARRPRKTGADCVNLVETCGANNDDAQYHRSRGRFTSPDIGEDAGLFVVGVNHRWAADHLAGSPKVTYASLTLNNWTRGVGVATQFDRELEGSLDAWLPERLPDFALAPNEHDALYVVRFARRCPDLGPPCIEIDDGALGVRPQDRLWFTERVYLNQTSGTAPAHDSVWAPRIVATAPRITETSDGAWELTE